MMDMISRETLTALFKDLLKGLYIGLALFGAGLGGLPLTFDDVRDL
jgi:hypothetical protein